MPDEPEAVGLLALMLLTDARRPARTAPTARWSASPTRTAPAGTARSSPRATRWCARCLRRNQPGPFQIQAAIAAVHADAADGATRPTGARSSPCTTSSTRTGRPRSWRINRAIAVGERDGAAAGLAALDGRRRRRPRRLPAVPRGPGRSARAGRTPGDAVAAYDRAIELTTNPAEHRFLRDQRRRVVRP